MIYLWSGRNHAFFWGLLLGMALAIILVARPALSDFHGIPEWGDELQPAELVQDDALFPITDSQAELRADVLGKIDHLTNILRAHYGASQQIDILAALAGGIGVVVVDGFLTAVTSRMMSFVMSQGPLMPSAGAAAVYSGFALALAWQTMRILDVGSPIALRSRVQYALESVLGGQFAGYLTWSLSRDLWPLVVQKSPASLLAYIDAGRRMKGYPKAHTAAEWNAYNSSVHYLMAKMVGSFWYYTIRTALSAKTLEYELSVVEDNLASARETLARLEKAQVALNKRLAEQAGVNINIDLEALKETDPETIDPYSPDYKHTDENQIVLDLEEGLRQEESDR